MTVGEQIADELYGLYCDIGRLETENAKLRELVIEVFECARRGAACETCKVNNDGYACVYIMRELGVEVDK